MITIRNLRHSYPGQRHTPPHLALVGLDLEISAGEFFVLTGPNGGGKSTLFRILCGLLRPSSGSVTVAGHDLFREPARVRPLLGVVFQKPALDKHLSVLENLRIHGDLYGVRGALFRERLEQSLEWSGLSTRLEQRVGALSGGLARQVELVKALLHHPTILLMDEPSTGLDPGARHAFVQTIHRIQRERQLTVLMTSHIFSEAEDADSVAILQQGRLLARDHPDTLRKSLGREMLVVESDQPEQLERALAAREGVTVLRRNGELRLECPQVDTLLSWLMAEHRQHIRTLSVKQPTLDDVYIHITGHSVTQDDAPAWNGGEDAPPTQESQP